MASSVILEYSINDGIDWMPISTVSNTDSYDWLIPPVDSTECLVQISDASNKALCDTSDDSFTIFVCRLNTVADNDNDCKVDLADFALMAADWLRNGNPFDEGFTE